MSASEIVNKVWNYAHVLRDDGVGYGDYVEQINIDTQSLKTYSAIIQASKNKKVVLVD